MSCIVMWICLITCFVNSKADLFFDEEFNADEDLTRNPYLRFLPPAICGFGEPTPPLASECCIEPPMFPKEDFKQCLNVPDLKELDINTLNCTMLSCVFTLNELLDKNGYFIHKRFVKYIDHWSQLYPGYEIVATHMKTQCFFHFHRFSIHDLPCLMITLYACYLDKILEACPVFRSDDECQATADYKRLCKQSRVNDITDLI